jgi:hypothetical protein
MAGPRLSAQVGETPLSLTMSQIAEKTGVEGIARSLRHA